MRFILSKSLFSSSKLLAFNISKFLEISNNVSISDIDPNEMYKNCINSFVDFRLDPSEILVGTDTAALLN